MKKILSFSLFILFTLLAFSQELKPIAQKINERKSLHAVFKEAKLLSLPNHALFNLGQFVDVVKTSTIIQFNSNEALSIINSKAANLLFTIPVSVDSSIELELFQSSIFTPDFKIVSSSHENISFTYDGGLHYWGIIKGDNKSIAAISIFENEVMGIISSPLIGNLILGKLKNDSNGRHILYNEKDLLYSPKGNCYTVADTGSYRPDELILHRQSSVNCIRLYWELNYDIFLDKGSVATASNYAIALFNESAILYANDAIPVELSQIYIWDTPSPYTQTTTTDLLHEFQSYRNSFAGDLGHLLGYEGGGGVAAGVNGLCASNLDNSQCYSMIDGSFQNVPVFSWSVEVVTHEQGHLMGSRHTHACVWNGNYTAIDGCGPAAGFPYEGSCTGAYIPSGGGTIMSYCHLVSAGINFSLGFGSQPAAVILNKYNNATCLTPCTNGAFCSAASGTFTSNITTTTATFNWNVDSNVVSYVVHYRILGTTSWLTDTTSNSFYNVTGLIPGSNYEWQVQSVCSASNGLFTSSTDFITVPLSCSPPTGTNTINITSLSALFIWDPAPAAIGYNIQYRLVGSTAWTSATTVNNLYHVTGLTPNSDYEWEVQTICAGGGTSIFSNNILFSTFDSGAPVTIVLQPDGDCVKDALIGSNVPTGTNIANYGNSYEFNALAWTASGSSSNHRSLLQFDLSFIPPRSVVSSAYLSLYWNNSSTNPGHSTMSGPNNAILSRITSPWDENTVTWVNQPGSTNVHQVSLPSSVTSNQDYLHIDVKDMVQDFIDDPSTNYGMMLQEVTETAYRSLVFASSDNPDQSLHPKLEITYAPNVTECLSYQYSNCNGTDALIGNCILAGYDTSNFGTTPEFEALSWTYSGTRTDFRSLIYWDLSAIPVNAIVDSATLSLFWNPNSSNPGHSSQSGSNQSLLLKITSPWSEDGVTWNTQPSVDSLNTLPVFQSSSPQQDYIIDIKSMVQDMVSNPATNYGMMLKLENENHFRSLIFSSSDHPDPARHPRIDVCYRIPNNIGTVLSQNEISIRQDFVSENVIIKSEKEFEKEAELFLFDTEGRIVWKSGKLLGNIYIFHRGNIAAGLYIMKLNGINTSQTGKIIFK